jgi:hypothetical protein
MPNNNFYRGVRRTEVDMRQEMINFLDGSYPEISKKQAVVLRRMRRDSNDNRIGCACVDDVSGEPDKDHFCIACFTGDSFIFTDNGYEKIEDIRVGNRVLGKSGSFHPVSKVHKRYTDELMGIKTRLRCDEIKVTYDHIFPVISVLDRKQNKFIISEKKAENLEIDDLLLMPKPNRDFQSNNIIVDWEKYKKTNKCKSIDKLPYRIDLSDDFLWMIGLWIAEGHIGGDREIVFTLHIRENDFANRVEKCFKAINPDITVKHIEKPESHKRSVHIYNSILARWIGDICGKGCENKKIPNFIFNNSPELAMKTVEGIWDGDGHTIHIDNDRSSDRGSIGMTSREVIYQCQTILWLNGFFAGLSTYKRVNKKRVYSLEWRLEPASRTRQFFEFDDYWATQITSLRKLDSINIPVYDLTVDHSDHMYVVNNTLAHNCFGEGWYWDEIFLDAYKVVIKSDVGNALIERTTAPSLANVPIVLFYTDYAETITRDDKIVELRLNNAGDIVRPYQRMAIYRISAIFDFRADNGRLEYYKIATYEEDVRFLNGADG